MLYWTPTLSPKIRKKRENKNRNEIRSENKLSLPSSILTEWMFQWWNTERDLERRTLL